MQPVLAEALRVPAREPTDAEYEDLLFGWLVESGITSNSVIYVKDLATVSRLYLNGTSVSDEGLGEKSHRERSVSAMASAVPLNQSWPRLT